MGQICEPLFKNIKKMLHINDNNIMWKGFQVCRTIVLASIGHIFFNASSLSSAIYMVKNIFRKTDILIPASRIYKNFWMGGSGKLDLILLILFIAMHIYADTKTYKNQSAQDTIKKYPTIIRWVLYYGLFYLILFERFIVETHFIYGGF